MTDREPMRLALMADYLADPIWQRAPNGGAGPMIALEQLPLSAATRAKLRAWARRFDALMSSGYEWPSVAAESAWVADGRGLLGLVGDELGPGYDVAYLHASPDEHAG